MVAGIPTGAENVVIEVHQGATIAGRLVDPSGSGVGGLPVTLSPQEDLTLNLPIPGVNDIIKAASSLLNEETPRTVTDAEGAFTFRFIPHGREEMTLEASGPSLLPFRQTIAPR